MYEKKDLNTITVMSVISTCQKCADMLDEEGIEHCLQFLGYYALNYPDFKWSELASIACHIKDMLWIYDNDNVAKNCVFLLAKYADMIIHNMIVNWCKEIGMELDIYTK